MAPNPLQASTILSALPYLLPNRTSQLKAPADALALLIHGIHTAVGFRLVSPAAEPQGQVQERDTESEATAVNQDEPTHDQANRLGNGWNIHGEDMYALEYRHEQSSLVFRVRIMKLGNRIQAVGAAESEEAHTMSVLVADALETSFFPWPRPDEDEPRNLSGAFKNPQQLIDKYNSEVLSKLIPGLTIDGYEQPRPNPPSRRSRDPAPARPSGPQPPLIDPTSPSGLRLAHPRASVGHRDLDPLSSARGPGNFDPSRDGGGMYMDFNHPLFSDRIRGPSGGLGQGPGGSIQPPGSRWDPVGPSPGGIGGNPLNGMGVGDEGFGWGDEMPPPGEFGPDLGAPRRGGGARGRGGIGGPLGGLGGLGGGLGGGRMGGGGGGFGGLGGGGGGMYM